jgi:hypothetical protein
MGCAGRESLRCPAIRAFSTQCLPLQSCSYRVRPNSNKEVCVKISGVIVGRNSSAGDAHVSVRGFLDTEFLMKVVNSIKMKPSEVALRDLLSIRAVHRRLGRDELSSCKSSRKLEWHCPSSCAGMLIALLHAFAFC